MVQCIIARHINGISLNDYEYILDKNNDIQVFDSIREAIDFLNEHDILDIEFYKFFSYSQFEKGIYEEVESHGHNCNDCGKISGVTAVHDNHGIFFGYLCENCEARHREYWGSEEYRYNSEVEQIEDDY